MNEKSFYQRNILCSNTQMRHTEIQQLFQRTKGKKKNIILPVGCKSEVDGRGCKPHRFSILLRSLRSNKCIKIKGSMSNKLLVAAEHKCALLDILLLAPTQLWLLPTKEIEKTYCIYLYMLYFFLKKNPNQCMNTCLQICVLDYIHNEKYRGTILPSNKHQNND